MPKRVTRKSSTLLADEESLRHIVREAVKETLNGLGFNTNAPQEMQANLLYLQKIRKGSEFIALRAKASIIAFLVPTLLYVVWETIRNGLYKAD